MFYWKGLQTIPLCLFSFFFRKLRLLASKLKLCCGLEGSTKVATSKTPFCERRVSINMIIL